MSNLVATITVRPQRKILFFLQTFFLSAASLFQAWLHTLYEWLIPLDKSKQGDQINILIIQLGHIGDFILSKPLFLSLRAYYGDRLYLTIVIDECNAEVASKESVINEVIIYNSSKYSRMNQKSTFKDIRSQLANRFFHVAIWLRGDLSFLGWLVKHRIYMKSVHIYPNPLRRAWIPLLSGFPVREKRTPHFTDILGYLYETITHDKVEYKKALREMNTKRDIYANDTGEIYIHIGAGNKLRQWPLNRYMELSRLLLTWDENINIKFIGSIKDRDTANMIMAASALESFGQRMENICGELSLSEIESKLRNGCLYIGFDSGPMHIAAFSGIPIVALYGPQSPGIFGPIGSQQIQVIYKKYFCSPCWQFSCYYNEDGPGACVLSIEPEEVYKEAEKILQKRGM